MKSTDLPTISGTPFAANGSRTAISQNTTPGSNAASYSDGFPAITMTDLADGGLPPRGTDFNQILYELARSSQWAGTGALYPYSQSFADAIGGYPKNSMVIADDGYTYISLSDDNKIAPPSSGWESVRAASKISLSQGGTVQSALDNVVAVEMFSDLAVGDNWLPAFEKARDVAVLINAPSVTFDGNYYLPPSATETWCLPFDDGTYDPRRTGEVTLTPEEKIFMKVALSWPSNLKLIGSGTSKSSISTDWDGSTVDTNQTIAICVRPWGWDGTYDATVGAKNRMTRDVRGVSFDGFTFKNAMIGGVCDGIVGSDEMGEIAISNCMFGMLWQGGDRTKVGRIVASTNCSAALISGGWWLTRNDISGSSTGLGVPPYVAGTDVYCIGWNDAIEMDRLGYTNSINYTATSIHAKADDFFDTYIYKSKNSVRTADGGRCTNTGPNRTSPSTLSTTSPFPGVATRAWAQLGRYQRYNILNRVSYLKTYGSCVPPIWTTLNGSSELNVPGCIVDVAYVEAGNKVDMAAASVVVGGDNDFATNGASKYLIYEKYTKCYAATGAVTIVNAWPVNSIGIMPSERAMAKSEVGYASRIRRSIIDNNGSPKIIEQLEPGSYLTPPQKFVRNATGTTEDRFLWKYMEKNISSKLIAYSGIPTASSEVKLSPTAVKAFIERIGNRVKLKISMNTSIYASGGSNSLVIGFTGIYAPITYASDNYNILTNAPVKTILLSSLRGTVTGVSGGTFYDQVTPKIARIGGITRSDGTRVFYFILGKYHSSTTDSDFLWSDMNGSTFNIEIEYDTEDDIESSNVW